MLHSFTRRCVVVFGSLLLSLSVHAADVGTDALKAANANLEACGNGMKAALAGYKPGTATALMKRAVKTGEEVQTLGAAERGLYAELLNSARLCAAAHKAHGAVVQHLADLAKGGKALPAETEAEVEKMHGLLRTTAETMVAASKLEGLAEMMFRVMSGKS
jgi:hypothetical protein